MNKNEAQIILMALEGLQANIDTLRNLVSTMVAEPQSVVNGICQHLETREIQTHGGSTTWCDDCGTQIMGVLDASNNK